MNLRRTENRSKATINRMASFAVRSFFQSPNKLVVGVALTDINCLTSVRVFDFTVAIQAKMPGTSL